MEPADFVSVQLAPDEIHLLLEGLDAYEYWQLGDVLPRNNGMVFLPDDPYAERYWPTDEAPSERQLEAIDDVRACRALAERLGDIGRSR
jgi:hypothetical protein